MFVWWYSGRGDRGDYDTYEIYFEGSVSGLSKGSPVRYLGVDVGRVTALSVDKRDARRVKVIADIDSSAPISGATQAKLGLLGLTGLLYIDLQQDPNSDPRRPLARGEAHPVLAAGKGSIEASVEKLPELLNKATGIMARIETMLADGNIESFGRTLANLERASETLPETLADARALAADLRRISESTLALTGRLDQTLERSQPDLQATLANARDASEKLARTADGLDRLINANGGSFSPQCGRERGRTAAARDRCPRGKQRGPGAGARVARAAVEPGVRAGGIRRGDAKMTMRSMAIRLACTTGAVLLLAGCGDLLKSDTPRAETYRLGSVQAPADNAAAAVTGTPPLALTVARPRAAAALDSERIAVVAGGNRFDYYAGVRWAEPAPQMLQQNLVAALARSGRFAGVFAAPARVPSELMLDIEIGVSRRTPPRATLQSCTSCCRQASSMPDGHNVSPASRARRQWPPTGAGVPRSSPRSIAPVRRPSMTSSRASALRQQRCQRSRDAAVGESLGYSAGR